MNSDYSVENLYGVYGASGCGRGIMPLARAQYIREFGTTDHSRLVFIDDGADGSGKCTVNGHMVLTYVDFLATPARARHVVVAIANSAVRFRLARQCVQDGILPWSVVAPNAIIMDDVLIGDGAAISPFVTITSNIRIGTSFHANLGSYVEHDCVIGDFVTFAPGAKCNGNVVVEDGAYLGAGCVIKQGTPDRPLVIGKGAIIGMGAVVTKSVAAGTTVVGSPARVLQKN